MTQLLSGPGFLGTQAHFLSDLTLILISTTAVLLTIGWQLARHRHFAAHRWVQTVTVAINAIVVLGGMVNSYAIHILPGIPARLLEDDYGITTVHAIVGMMGIFLGIFVVLRANGLAPQALRFQNYKLFMRTAYALYMLATLLGVTVYFRGYVLGI